VGQYRAMPFKDRNTSRARELRNAATPAERVLWRYLGGKQLGVRFNRQMPVGPFFADFLCREYGLIVELDGHSHDIAPERDIYRDRYLSGAGYRVLHFANADIIANVEGALTVIRSELERLAHP